MSFPRFPTLAHLRAALSRRRAAKGKGSDTPGLGASPASRWPSPHARRLVGGALVAGVAASSLASGCFTSSDGLTPPTTVAYFPTALAISPGRSTLYVANSDFDLQYSGGTVQALDLGGTVGVRTYARTLAQAIDTAVKSGGSQADACATIDTKPNDESFVHPGPCTPLPIGLFVRNFASIGAFASQAVLLQRSDGPGARLFVTVRGDPSVTYFDVADDRDPNNLVSACGSAFCLDCAGTGDGKRCAPSHLIGSDPFDNLRGLKMPTEPIGIDVNPMGSAGDPIVVANQSTNQASLIVNRWPGTGVAGPTLEYSLIGLPDGPTGVAHIPPPGIIKARNGLATYRPGFIVTHRAAAELSVLRYADDGLSEPERPFLTKSASVPITLAAQGNDSRGIAIDSSKRDACEAKCAADALSCFESCLDTPLAVYVASRAPASLLVGHIDATASKTNGAVTSVTETVVLDGEEPLPVGASNVSIGHVVNAAGKLETRVFVVSFDSRFVMPYDPHLQALEAPIRTGRGPFGMAFDTTEADPASGQAESYLYVSHFTDSYLGVIDLDTRRRTYGQILINVGTPTPPKGEKR